MKLDVILNDQYFRIAMGSSSHYRLLAVNKVEVKQWFTFSSSGFFCLWKWAVHNVSSASAKIFQNGAVLSSWQCYSYRSILNTSFYFYIYCARHKKKKKKLECVEESLNILVGLLFYIQLPQDTVSIVVVLLHGRTSDFSFDSHLAQISTFNHKCPSFPQSCLLLPHQTWQLWRLLMQQKLTL